MDQDLIRRLPKTDLHVHLDGSLRLATLIELARARKVALPSETPEGLEALVFRPRYANLNEYLEGFQYTVAVLQDDGGARARGVRAGRGLPEGGRPVPRGPLRAPAPRPAGLRRPERRPGRRPRAAPRGRRLQPPPRGPLRGRSRAFASGIILCAMRFFTPGVLARLPALLRGPARGARARRSTPRRASRWRAPRRGCGATRGCSSSGSTSPARRRATRRRTTARPTRSRTRPSSARPSTPARTTARSRSSRRSATCTPTASATAPGCSTTTQDHEPARSRTASATSRTSPSSSRDKRITIEVCLTSNQQTVPELADDLRQHPFAEMRRRRLSTTFCTDNRLVSHTTVQPGDRARGRGLRPDAARGARHPDLRLQAQLLPGHATSRSATTSAASSTTRTACWTGLAPT